MTQAGAQTDAVDTFIVRIYRREAGATDEPVGTVECVGSGERQGFAGLEELWDRLFLAGNNGRNHRDKKP